MYCRAVTNRPTTSTSIFHYPEQVQPPQQETGLLIGHRQQDEAGVAAIGQNQRLRPSWEERLLEPRAAVLGCLPRFPGEHLNQQADFFAIGALYYLGADGLSVALIVLRRGQVVLEQYWQGMTPAQLFSGRAMSRSIVGMVYGFAVAEGKLPPVDAGTWLVKLRSTRAG